MIAIVFAAGLLQGIALIVYPAAGNLFREAYHLSPSEYGWLFAPQIVGAVLASSSAGPLARRFGMRRIFVAGLVGDALSMLLLAVSAAATARPAAAYALLLAGNGALGLGFGAALTAMNTYVARLRPDRATTTLTALHATLGVGTALPPLALRAAVWLGAWWLLPVVVCVFGAVAAIALWRSEEPAAATGASQTAIGGRLGARFWAFAGAAFLYGFCEALIADWGAVYLHEERALTSESAGLALSAFWAALTGGRILVALVGRFVPTRAIYVTLPVGLAGAYLAARGAAGEAAAIGAFAAVGFACSAFFPLTISLGTAAEPTRAETAAGLLLATFMTGAGLGGSGVGVLHEHGMIAIAALFAAASAVAATLALLSFALTTPARVTSAGPAA